jgi:hypothetical protein
VGLLGCRTMPASMPDTMARSCGKRWTAPPIID